MPGQQQQQSAAFDPVLEALNRIKVVEAKHPNDRRAQHRAAEIAFWNDWYRTGPDGSKRDERYALAAIACAELYHNREDDEEKVKS